MKKIPFINEETEPIPLTPVNLHSVLRTLAHSPEKTTVAEVLLRSLQSTIFQNKPLAEIAVINLEDFARTAEEVASLLHRRGCRQAVRFKECSESLRAIRRFAEKPPADVSPDRWATALTEVALAVAASYAPLEDWAFGIPLAGAKRTALYFVNTVFNSLLGAETVPKEVAVADAIAHILSPSEETDSIDRRFDEARKSLKDRRLAQQVRRLYYWELELERSAVDKEQKHPLASSKEDLEGDLTLPEDAPSPLELAPSSSPDPAQVVADKDAVEHLLARFGKRTADLLQLMMDGKTIAEAARILGISESTARVLLHKARKQFSRKP